MGYEAGVKAMIDAGINYDDVEQGVACYVYGDSTCGQRVFYQFGMQPFITCIKHEQSLCREKKMMKMGVDKY